MEGLRRFCSLKKLFVLLNIAVVGVCGLFGSLCYAAEASATTQAYKQTNKMSGEELIEYIVSLFIGLERLSIVKDSDCKNQKSFRSFDHISFKVKKLMKLHSDSVLGLFKDAGIFVHIYIRFVEKIKEKIKEGETSEVLDTYKIFF